MTPAPFLTRRFLSMVALFGLLMTLPLAGRSSPVAAVDPFLQARLGSQAAEERLGVFVHAGSSAAAEKAAGAAGLDVVAAFDRVAVVAAAGPVAAVRRVIAHPAVTYVEADRPAEYFLRSSHQATRGEDARTGFTAGSTSVPGVDGSGVTVAEIDSGVDGTHPMFQSGGQSRVVRNVKLLCVLTGCVGNSVGNARDDMFVDAPTNDSDGPSAGGHGTHVAGIAVGGDVTTLEGHQLHGAASGAKLVAVSVGSGISVYGGAAGMNWVLEHHAQPCGASVPASVCPPVKVVNNSWGVTGGGAFAENSVIVKIQRQLVLDGVTVVWANGNDGGDGTANRSTIYGQDPTPGVLSVANYSDANNGTRDGGLSSSSSRGLASLVGSFPDISAPGSSILSACRPNLPICTGGSNDLNYGAIGGTSMAAPHIAGITAQVVQAYRQKNGTDPAPAYIENLLEDTAYKFAAGGAYQSDPANPDDTTSFDKGHGLVDVRQALSVLWADPEVETAGALFACVPGGAIGLDPKNDVGPSFIPSTQDPATSIPAQDPAFDIREGRATWDGGTSTLTAAIKVEDLPAVNTTAPGASYTVEFGYAGQRLSLRAWRGTSGAPEFTLGRITSAVATSTRTVVATVSGSFDDAGDVVSISVTNSQLAAASVPPIVSGNVLDAFSFATSTAGSAAGNNPGAGRDSLTGACRLVAGTGTQPLPLTLDGKISEAVPSFSWNSVIYTRSTPGQKCTSATDAKCDIRKVEVAVPNGGVGDLTAAISSTDGTADFDLYVFAPNGALLGSSANAGTSTESVTKPVNVAGVYTVSVLPVVATDAAYSGTATLANLATNASLGAGGSHAWTSAPLSTPSSTAVCAGPADARCDRRRLSITVPSGGTGEIDVAVSMPAPSNFDMFLFGPSGAEVARSAQAGSATEQIKREITASGVYTVAVLPVSATAATYNGTAALNALATHGVLSSSSATHSWSGASVTGGFNNLTAGCAGPADAKCLRTRLVVTLAQPEILTVELSSPDPASDFDFYVYGPDGVEVGRAATESSNEMMFRRVTASGVYTISVNPYIAQATSFNATAKLAEPVLPSSSYDGAVESGSPYSWNGAAVVTTKASAAWLRCTSLTATTVPVCDSERIWAKGIPGGGKTLTVSIATTAEQALFEVRVYVLDPNGTIIAAVEDGGPPTKTLSVLITMPGVYTVAVSNDTGPVSYSGTAELA